MMRPVDVSLVIPCYQDGPIVPQGVAAIVEVMAATRWTYELILVDDGSTDDTRRHIEGCRSRHPDVPIRVVSHAINLGRGRAVCDGVRAAAGRIAGYLDIDLEVHARYLPAMIEAIDRQGYDGAVAWRMYELTRPVWFRGLCSRGYHTLMRRCLGLPFHDTEAGFKFFRRDAFLHLIQRTCHPGWFWDTEVMAWAWLQGLRIQEIPCLFIRRLDKRSSVRVWRDSWEYLRALLRFRRRWLQCPPQTGWLYRLPWLYRVAMAVLYRRRARRRLAAVARHIPPGASVLDVCSGDCALHRAWGRRGGLEYLGVDLNPRLLHAGARRGARVRLLDVRHDALPPADVVVMQDSLYQFLPDAEAIVQKLFQAARARVIVAEPVDNWAGSRQPWRRWLAARATNPGTGPAPHRFTPASFEALVRRYRPREVARAVGGRDLVAVFDVNGH